MKAMERAIGEQSSEEGRLKNEQGQIEVGLNT
jgi:hypothetical protein